MSHDWGEKEGTHVFVFHNLDFFRSYKTFYCVYYHHCLYILYALFRLYSMVWTLLETWCVSILTVSNMQLLQVMNRWAANMYLDIWNEESMPRTHTRSYPAKFLLYLQQTKVIHKTTDLCRRSKYCTLLILLSSMCLHVWDCWIYNICNNLLFQIL